MNDDASWVREMYEHTSAAEIEAGRRALLSGSVGGSLPLFNVPEHRMLGAVEFNHPPDGDERINLGGEYVYQRFGPNFEIAVRGGYRLNRDEEALTGGFGIKFPFVRIGLVNKPSIWSIDYCYSDMGLLESSHKISLSASY